MAIMNEVHDIMSESDENACLHAFEERRMAIVDKVHDRMIAIVCSAENVMHTVSDIGS